MKNTIHRLLAAFIINREKRQQYRAKHIKKKKPLVNTLQAIEGKVNAITHELNQLKATVNATIIPEHLPQARGLERTIQLLGLEMLKDLDRVCRKHDIKYWIDFGTLLGAIRHKCFLPWDDDIDISMPYDDYLRFQEVAPIELENSVAVFPPGHWGKLIHKDFAPQTKEELLIPFRGGSKTRVYVSLDIFPFHHMNKEWNRDTATTYIREKCKEKVSLVAQEEKKTGRNHATWARVHEMFKAQEDAIVSTTPSEYMFMSLGWYFQHKELFPPRIARTCDIFPLQEIEFEGYRFWAPGNAEMWMWCVYGNFWEMKIFPSHMHIDTAELEEIQKLMKHAKRLNCL